MLSLQRSSAFLIGALTLWLSFPCATAVAAVGDGQPGRDGGGTQIHAADAPRAATAAVLADGWSWSEFFKFWQRQGGKTSGILGIVLLVGLGAVLLILSKSRR